eukprot:12418359-Karenia_brevis.AAC.1
MGFDDEQMKLMEQKAAYEQDAYDNASPEEKGRTKHLQQCYVVEILDQDGPEEQQLWLRAPSEILAQRGIDLGHIRARVAAGSFALSHEVKPKSDDADNHNLASPPTGNARLQDRIDRRLAELEKELADARLAQAAVQVAHSRSSPLVEETLEVLKQQQAGQHEL